jgi:hypothetical protein
LLLPDFIGSNFTFLFYLGVWVSITAWAIS